MVVGLNVQSMGVSATTKAIWGKKKTHFNMPQYLVQVQISIVSNVGILKHSTILKTKFPDDH